MEKKLSESMEAIKKDLEELDDKIVAILYKDTVVIKYEDKEARIPCWLFELLKNDKRFK